MQYKKLQYERRTLFLPATPAVATSESNSVNAITAAIPTSRRSVLAGGRKMACPTQGQALLSNHPVRHTSRADQREPGPHVSLSNAIYVGMYIAVRRLDGTGTTVVQNINECLEDGLPISRCQPSSAVAHIHTRVEAHRRSVARSNCLLWPAPQASGTL